MSPPNTEFRHGSSRDLDPPADSYRLQLGDEIDWIDVHKVYGREESVKEATNPKSHSHAHISKNVGNNSQRFSGNLKSGIIGLPGNIQNSSIMGQSARRPSCVRIIPQKNGSSGKPSVLEAEPGSPKVSCMGKVLSEKPKGRSQLRRKSAAKATPARSGAKKLVSNKTLAKTEHKGPSCLFRMARIFCSSRKRAMDVADESVRLERGTDFSVSARISFGKDVRVKGRRSLEREVAAKEAIVLDKENDTPVPVPVPGIGGIKRFASGRKAEWNFEVENDNTDDEVKGRKSVEKDADVKEKNTCENEKDTPFPVLVLGLGGLKRFASGRKVDWSFETEADGGNFATDEVKENDKLENGYDLKERNNSLEKENDTCVSVPVLGISVMKRFASGRKSDWNFEAEKENLAKEEVKESNALKKSVDQSVLGIGMVKRFSSGRKVEWTIELDTDGGSFATEEAKEKTTLQKDGDVKERDTTMEKERDNLVAVPGIGAMKRFTSGRKVEWNFDNAEDDKENKTLKMDADAKERGAPATVSAPRIGSMRRFTSGRKLDWNFKVEAEEAHEKVENNVDAKEKITLKEESTDAPVTAVPRGIGTMKKFTSGRKLDWNFEA